MCHGRLVSIRKDSGALGGGLVIVIIVRPLARGAGGRGGIAVLETDMAVVHVNVAVEVVAVHTVCTHGVGVAHLDVAGHKVDWSLIWKEG